MSTWLSYHSNGQDASWVGFRQCRKSHNNYQLVLWVGFLQHAWESAARLRLTCGSYQSACSTGEDVQSPLKLWGHLSFCNRGGTTSSRISNQGWKENCSEPLIWHTSMVPLTWWVKLQRRLSRPVSGNLSEWQWPRELLRVQMYHRSQMIMLFGVIRKLMDLTWWQRGLHNVYFIKVAPDGKD